MSIATKLVVLLLCISIAGCSQSHSHSGHANNDQKNHATSDPNHMNHMAMNHQKKSDAHTKMDDSKIKQDTMNHSKMNHANMKDHKMDHAKMDHSKMDHSMHGMDHSGLTSIHNHENMTYEEIQAHCTAHGTITPEQMKIFHMSSAQVAELPVEEYKWVPTERLCFIYGGVHSDNYAGRRSEKIRKVIKERNEFTNEEWNLIDQQTLQKGGKRMLVLASWGHATNMHTSFADGKRVEKWGYPAKDGAEKFVILKNSIIDSWQN